MKKKIRKESIQIQKGIIRSLLRNIDKKNLSIDTISKENDCNWLTIKKFSKNLEDNGIIEIIRVEGREVGLCLNIKGIRLFNQVALEEGLIKSPTPEDLVHQLLQCEYETYEEDGEIGEELTK